MTPIYCPDTKPYPRLRRFAVDFVITIFFSIAIALVVTYVMRIHESFFDNLVISLCIGSLAVTFIDGGRLLLWGRNKPPMKPFLILFFVSMPAAQFLGNVIAGLLLGIPSGSIGATVRATNPVGFAVLFVLTCVGISWFFWNRGHMIMLKAEAEAEKARAAAIEKQAMQAQLQLLQAQIEPHMLFNTLANLQGLIAVDAARAQHMLDQLIQYLRATLSSSRSEKTSLAHEFSLMEAYLGLMAVRMGSRLSYALHLPDALREQMVPPMLLQPLVENAIKHGLEPKLEGGHIDVKAAYEAGILTLTVADNGLGLSDGPCATAGTSVGVSNIRERLQALYGERAAFSLNPNTPSGVIAQLTLPL
jgi:signal transduction histidine kinase